LRALGAGNDAEIHLWLSYLEIWRTDSVVRGHGDLEAAAQRVAVHGGNHRLRRVLHESQHGRQKGAGAGSDKLRDVGACHERPAAADQDDGVYVVVGDRGAQQGVQFIDDAGAQRVDRRILDRDDCDTSRVSDRVTPMLNAVGTGQRF